MKLEEIMDMDAGYVSDVEKEAESSLRAFRRYLINTKKRIKENQEGEINEIQNHIQQE